jgi:hypothetical protein
MPKVRVLVGTLAYGPSPDRTKIAQKGEVIELSDEELGRLTVAPAYPATVETIKEEKKPEQTQAKPTQKPSAPK